MGQCTSTLVVNIGFKFVEFEENNRINIKQEFQVDKTINHEQTKYNSMYIIYSNECFKLLDNFIPLKCVNTLTDYQMCEMLYLIHINSLLIKEMEEHAN